MSVGTYCQKGVETVTRDESLRSAARQMESKGVGCLVAVDDHDRPIGVLTDRDAALRGLERGRDPDQMIVGDIMSRLTSKAREATPVATALQRMASDGVRRLPVVDSHGRLAGIFGYDDALQLVARNIALAANVARAQFPMTTSEPTEEGSWEIPTARGYHRDPVTLDAQASVQDAIDEMEEAETGCVVVIGDDRAPIGILTDRDIMCRVLAAGTDPQRTRVADVMSENVVSSSVDASLHAVLERAQTHAVRRIPLVDDSGRLVAIVSLDDVVAELTAELASLSDAVRTEMRGSHPAALQRR